jgi:hypothetical protein
MSKKPVILAMHISMAFPIKCGTGALRCIFDGFALLVNSGMSSWILALIFCLISANVRADDGLGALERLALIQAANTESAYFQRANVQLIAPEVQQQIQDIADQISLAAGAERRFKVFVLNEKFLMTQSFANGDIFITTGYLDMIEDRDELAFGLAREIAMQIKGLRLKEMEQQLKEQRHQRNANFVLGLVVNTTVGVFYGHYVVGPLNSEIIKATGFKPTPILVGIKTVPGQSGGQAARGPGGVIYAPAQSGPQQSGVNMPDFNSLNTEQGLVSIPDSVANWLPNLVNSKILTITSHLVDDAFKEADPEHRRLKDQLGIAFMQMAGYNGESGQKVIKKIDAFMAFSNSATNVPTKNELK